MTAKRRYFIPTENNPDGDVFERLPVPGLPEAESIVNRTRALKTEIARLRRAAGIPVDQRLDVEIERPPADQVGYLVLRVQPDGCVARCDLLVDPTDDVTLPFKEFAARYLQHALARVRP